MTSLLVEDLSRSDDLDREELLAVRGGILIKEIPPEQGPQLPGFCGVPSWPIVPGWPNMPSWPTIPGPNCWWPSPPGGPASDPVAQ
jgi:hypothetical protein